MNEINDTRKENDFKGITFSKFKVSEVKKELLNNILHGKIENACYWLAELLCAGHYIDIWNSILLVMSQRIHLGNIKLPIYLEMRYQEFREIVQNGYIDNELRMRNNVKIRLLFAEIIAILSMSNKKHNLERIKIKPEEFIITELTSKLRADHVNYARSIYKKDDPKELFIAINEFQYHLSENSKNMYNACYWIEWILDFETMCKKKREKCIAERRTFANVDDKSQKDIVWIIWEGIIYESKKRPKIIQNCINALINLFTIRYTPAVKKRRIYILYYSVALLTEMINYNQELITNKSTLEMVKQKNNLIFKEIKKNEITPKTDYLFKGKESSSLEKSISKIEKMNSMLFLPK